MFGCFARTCRQPLPPRAVGRAAWWNRRLFFRKALFGLFSVELLSVGLFSVGQFFPEAATKVLAEDHGDSAASDEAMINPLVARGYSVTRGAAPGYVEDRLCGSCHRDLYDAYQEVGMAKSFYRPRPDKAIEDFENNHFFHAKSNRHYTMSRHGDRYLFQRYQLDAEDQAINVFEQEVDWILGSGSHVRVYLYRTAGGYVFQLPLAWYTRSASWGMAPGYDRADHNGVNRPITRECMFCHNAYPDVPAAADDYAAPHVFPAEIPEGLGCQRCHGPGAEHARIAMTVPVDFASLAKAIVDPDQLEPKVSRDICYGCHMQPAVVVDGVRRFGRGDYSFRPGEPLSSYLVQVEVEEAGRDRAERFEINHHPYRLEQSRCFIASKGALSCQTCHDPHRKVPPSERPAHYRAACLSCHGEVEACGMAEAVAAEPAILASLPPVEPSDCIGCHMQERRPQDVVQAVMTDHFIRRRPAGPELLAPLDEEDHALIDVRLLDPGQFPMEQQGDVYRAVAAMRVGSNDVVVDWLDESLGRSPEKAPDPYLDLARGQIEQRRIEAAQETLDVLLGRAPDLPQALVWQGLLLAEQGRKEQAIAVLERAVAKDPEWPASRSTLGRLLSNFGRPAEALEHLELAIDRRPTMPETHLYLGSALASLGRLEEAAASFRRALEIDPTHTDGYLGISQVMLKGGDRESALRFLHHGVETARQPAAVEEALAKAATISP